MEPNEVTEPARPDAVDEAPQPPRARELPPTGRQEQQRTPPSAHPGMPERFRDAVRPLDEIDARPVADHARTYDAVHRHLRTALDDVDRTS